MNASAAILFDFDGTLVDTMPLHYAAYRNVFERHGLSLLRSTFDAAVGGIASETIPKLLNGQVAPVGVRQLHEEKRAELRAILASVEVPRLATATIAEALVDVLPMAVVSSGSPDGISILIGRLGWDRLFQTVVSGADVIEGKPSPEGYLLAAQRLGVEPTNCLVFEDHDDGVAAACSAGMRVVDIRRTVARSAR